MTTITTPSSLALVPRLEMAWQDVHSSFERFCLTAGIGAMDLMLINVSTRKLRRAVRLPEGDLPVIAGDGTSKSAASRRFVALSAERLAEWMTSDLSKLDLLVIQIDGLHIGNDLVLVAALGI